jgi:pimeloyl-ACP methyl ester carboxylesterase
MTFRVFAAAVLVALLHAFDDAFLLPGGGVPLTQHALAFAIALGASALAVWRFRSFRPGVQAALAFVFGFLALVNGGRHAHHVLNGALTANDVTGLLAFAAGLALVGLAAWIPFRHRGEGSWPARLLIPPAGLVIVWFVLAPVGMGIVDIHSLHRPVGSPPNAAYKTVHFTASDGVRLEGWHRPSRNGASVLMISGGGGNRRSTLRHARLLERHGYGVLVYDPRGSGNSEGTVNSYGWGWDKDADAAMDYLAAHGGGRIGVLGLSTGADMAIDAAGRRSDVAAVVADGSAAIGFEDIEEYTPKTLDRAPMWVLFKAIEVVQGRSGPKVSLAERIAHTRTPNLLISANKAEKQWGELYDRRGGSRSTLWYLPHAGHTAALRQYPAAYERRVTAFLDAHLLT